VGDTHRQSWFRAVVLLAAFYAAVGIAFALPASHVRVWRLAAWVVSFVAYAAHVAYERFRFGSSPVSAALHVAAAAGLGALGLAVAALMRSLATVSPGEHQRLLLVALVAWPFITGVPAFLVGLCASGLLARLTRSARGD
jgi:hypothetical protein